MKERLERYRTILTRAAEGFGNDDVARLSAALSFYAVLSIAPVLVLAVALASLFYGEKRSFDDLMLQARGAVGQEGADLLAQLIQQSRKPGATTIATISSLVVTFFSASNLFIQLSSSIDSIWKIKSSGPFFKTLILSRVGAFLSVVVFGVIVLGWLVLDSWLQWLSGHVGGVASIWPGVSFLVTTVFLWGVFCVSFKLLPKGRVKWRDVYAGAFVAALGLAMSKYALSLYFRVAGVSQAYGSAGALVVILLWIYYTSQIYFFGIEMSYAAHTLAEEEKAPAKTAEGVS
jgi:membrane protein